MHRSLRDRQIKRFFALYFDASPSGEQLPDQDGEQYMEVGTVGFGGYVRTEDDNEE